MDLGQCFKCGEGLCVEGDAVICTMCGTPQVKIDEKTGKREWVHPLVLKMEEERKTAKPTPEYKVNPEDLSATQNERIAALEKQVKALTLEVAKQREEIKGLRGSQRRAG